MKKKIVIMMVLLLAVVGAKAQEVENPVGRFSVIPRIGVSLANWSGLTLETLDGTSLESKYQAGFMGGVDVEYRINKSLGITLGAYYARQGMRFPDCELTENAEKGEYTGIKNHHVNLDYIQVPLMLKAYLVEGLSLNAGVQVGFLCGDGKVKREETDNSGLLTDNNRLQTTVKLSRKLLANQWNTFCVPFGIDIADGKINGIEASVMEYDHTTGNTMEFKEATKIVAGKAYLVKPSADITNPQFDNVTIKNDNPTVSGDADGYSFVGIYNPKTFSDSDQERVLILASEAKFMRVNNGQRMKGMRAYFTIPTGTKAEAVRLMINNRPTALTEITTTPSTSEKIFYIDGTYAGSDIKNVKKGIVIKGGKKYWIR